MLLPVLKSNFDAASSFILFSSLFFFLYFFIDFLKLKYKLERRRWKKKSGEDDENENFKKMGKKSFFA